MPTTRPEPLRHECPVQDDEEKRFPPLAFRQLLAAVGYGSVRALSLFGSGPLHPVRELFESMDPEANAGAATRHPGESGPDSEGGGRAQPSAPRFAFEDFTPGSVATYGGVTVTKDDLVAFAREFDPQPFHLDEEAAKQTFVGGLIASGWHTCALQMRMICDAVVLDSTSMGAPGVEEVKWLKPVRPGDTLRVRQTVLGTRDSRSRAEMGFVRLRFETLNQADEPVVEQINWSMFGRRTPLASAGAKPISDPPRHTSRAEGTRVEKPLASASASTADMPPSPFFDDLILGHTRDLGSHLFTPEEIIAFARRFDPQPFHVDPEAGRRSHFGGLCASGWHTAAIWMKQMIAFRQTSAAAAQAQGQQPAQLGPSPGFKDLRWLKPVYAGDTITYRSTLVGKRPSASRAGWGLVFQHNTGDNQHGERVFEFTGGVFWPRKA